VIVSWCEEDYQDLKLKHNERELGFQWNSSRIINNILDPFEDLPRLHF
jgi:hypothetical protein